MSVNVQQYMPSPWMHKKRTEEVELNEHFMVSIIYPGTLY